MQRLFQIPELFTLEEVPVDLIDVQEYEKSLCQHLVKTVQEVGVLQTVVLVKKGERYKVIAGRRRVLACIETGRETIPAKVVDSDVSPEQIAYVTIVENLVRKPNPASEAESLSNLMSAYDWDALDAAKNLGIPASHIKSRLKLLKLIPEAFEKLRQGKLRVSSAAKIASLPKEKQRQLLQEEKITSEIVEDVSKKEKLKNLVLLNDVFHDIPRMSLLDHIINDLTRYIGQSSNGNREKLEKALKILKEIH